MSATTCDRNHNRPIGGLLIQDFLLPLLGTILLPLFLPLFILNLVFWWPVSAMLERNHRCNGFIVTENWRREVFNAAAKWGLVTTAFILLLILLCFRSHPLDSVYYLVIGASAYAACILWNIQTLFGSGKVVFAEFSIRSRLWTGDRALHVIKCSQFPRLELQLFSTHEYFLELLVEHVGSNSLQLLLSNYQTPRGQNFGYPVTRLYITFEESGVRHRAENCHIKLDVHGWHNAPRLDSSLKGDTAGRNCMVLDGIRFFEKVNKSNVPLAP